MTKVQCHEPSGSRPGFIVLQSDYIDNLRSTYTQLQRCFSTSYKDIMDINDNEHALMPKLKDIYRKVKIENCTEALDTWKCICLGNPSV